MKIVEIAEAMGTLAEYTSSLSEEPVIITSNGEPIAALINIENVDLETISLSTNPKFIQLIERSRSRRHFGYAQCPRAEGGISSDEMRRRLGIAEV